MAATSSTHPICYAPLKVGELRLVALQPGREHDTIKCKIEHSTFKAAKKGHKYKALSYMWGSPNELRLISINSKTFQARENLWWALYYLRSKEEVVMLWIDALCINQEDIDERNYQVGQMDRIYKGAEKVMIWVGCESPEDAKALEYIWEIFDKKWIPSAFSSELGETMRNKEWFEQYLHMWKEISMFCARPYWMRQWIIQEVVLAAEASVICGHKSMDWRIIRDVIYPVPLIEYEGEQNDIRQQIGSSRLREVIMQKWKAGPQLELIPLLDLIATHRAAKCLERRDKVFSLLSISEPCCRNVIPVDYSKPDYVLFVEVIEHHLRKHDGSDFLLKSRRALQSFFGDQGDSDLETSIQFINEVSSQNNELFEVPAQINDVVSYCTPSFNSLPPHYEKTILDDDDEWTPSDALVKQISDLFNHRQANVDQSEIVLGDFNNVQALDWKVSLDSREGQMDGLISGYMPLTRDIYRVPKISKSQVRQTIFQMICDAEKMASNSSLNANCKLFFTRNGRICFGPSTLQKGDLLSHFNYSGMDVILRLLRNEKKLVTVGNAVPYFARDIPIQEDTALARPVVGLHLDLTTLLLISLPENAARYYVPLSVNYRFSLTPS